MESGASLEQQHISSLTLEDRQAVIALKRPEYKDCVFGPGSALISVKSKYEFLGRVIQKYINPGVLRFVVATKQYEYAQKQFVGQYRGLTKITLLNPIQFNMNDYNSKFARL